ncbi:MAG: CARDB domain-containing protein [Candidatus Gracilibacteria bacterium]|jgi:hypothetical protein
MQENNKGKKALIMIVLLLVVIGIFGLVYSKGTMLKGQLLGNSTDGVVVDVTPLPDLEATVSLVKAPVKGEDLQLHATIKNLGPGSIDGTTPFKYAIEVNGKEVFSNTDSYTSMAAGDAFSFDYPVSQELNSYPDKGTVKFIVDSENSLKETSEDNNEKQIEYSY